MPYLFRLKPNAAQTPTFDEYAARFLAAGLQPFGVQSPNVRAFCIKNLGAVVVKDAPEEGGLYAEALIGLVTLGWNAADIRPRVEVWLRVAEETSSVIFDGHTMDALVDEVSSRPAWNASSPNAGHASREGPAMCRGTAMPIVNRGDRDDPRHASAVFRHASSFDESNPAPPPP